MRDFSGNNVPLRGGGTFDARPPPIPQEGRRKPKKHDDHDHEPPSRPVGVALASLPNWTGLLVKSMLGMTVALYVLNQKHMLPKPLGAAVSKALFWPTLPITISRRIGKWTSIVDDTVVMGGAPFGFVNFPERLYQDYGVRGVINLCQEYAGPVRKYEKLGIKELRLPTVDHFEPSVRDLKTAVSFIRAHEARGDRVYVHCRAGHGRSAAAVFAWLLYKDPVVDAKELNEEFCQKRNVRKSLWRQANIQEFHSWLKRGGVLGKEHTMPKPDAELNRFLSDPASGDRDL